LEGKGLDAIKVNTINEMEKLLHKKGLKLYLTLITLFPFLIMLVTEKVITNDMLVLPAVNLSYALLKGFAVIVIPLFIIVTTSELFSGERERNTLFMIRPIERYEIFLSKILAQALLIGLQLMLFYSITSISLLVFGKDFTIIDLGTLLFSTLVTWIPLLAIIVFTAVISQFFKSSGASVGIGILLYALMFILPYVVPGSLYAFPTAYLDWYQLWNENVSFRWMLQSILYLFSFCTLFFTVGYYMFKSKEM
jgi:ABC-2 type transport system permease protein